MKASVPQPKSGSDAVISSIDFIGSFLRVVRVENARPFTNFTSPTVGWLERCGIEPARVAAAEPPEDETDVQLQAIISRVQIDIGQALDPV